MALVHARRGGLLALLAVTAAACGEPEVGGKVVPPPAPEGYRLAIEGASIDATNHVVVTFTVTNDAAPVALADVVALRPAFTMAGLLPDPLSQANPPLMTWQSYQLTGSGTLANLPLGGPGTPPGLILQNQRQPGSETGTAATLADAGGGRFTMTLSTPLPAGFDPARTMRVGAWLGTAPGTGTASATRDWVPAGGAAAPRDTVLDANCNVCHGLLVAHGRRTGVKLCLTCHTIQNADPDTQDPAAPVRTLAVTPEARTVLAGSTGTTFTATTLSSTAAVTWSLSPASGAGSLGTATVATTSTGGATSTVRYTPPAPDAAQVDPIPVTLTASVTIQGITSGGYTPPAVVLSAPVAVTVLQPPAGPAVAVVPAAQAVVANGPAVPLAATLVGATGTISWTVSPSSGAGGLAATATGAPASTASGAAVFYTPPGAVAGPTTVTVTASAGGASGTCTFTVVQGVDGSATRYTDPNPLDLGRMVHRIHRGKNLPTLYLSSSIAAAPLLPPDGPPPAALPVPFPVGRTVAQGTKFSIWGFRATEFIAGRVVSRVENFQPPRTLAEGVTFPRDLRDCDACHANAPQRGELVTAASRRTCQGCHPDVWFGGGPAAPYSTGPITDLVHFAHPGGPQADDTRCAGCHVSGPGVRVPAAEAHRPMILSPYHDQPTVSVTRVDAFQAGQKPTVCFQVRDRRGELDSLQSPSAGVDPDPLHPSPVPRGLTRVSIVVAGPTTDYLHGNTPFSQTVPLTTPRTPGVDGVSQEFCHVFTVALPATAGGTWGLGMEARRAPSPAPALYDPATDTFRWPFTGEAVTEYSDNPVYYLDTAFGSWPGGAPSPRRNPIERNNCRSCHLEISFHGNLRHNPSYCVLCHTADATDWSRRPKLADGNVNLATVYSDTKFGTYDNLEERSIHFKVMIHRIHTGEGEGTARIEVGAPHVISGVFLDDIRFPNRLADCTLCHEGTTWLLEGQPADASPTIANETAAITHSATGTHASSEARMLPMAATCNSCHGTADAYQHAARYTEGETELCAQCHTRGALGVPAAHGLPSPAATP